MKVINLFAGPGAGKSTTAAGLFFLMKNKGYNVELITEFAKDLTWENRNKTLENQIYVFAKQYHRLYRLENKVEYVITDSPLLLSLIYSKTDYFNGTFANLVKEVWNEYINYSFFIERIKEYKQIGRSQDEEGAKKIDLTVLNLLNENYYIFKRVKGDINASQTILDYIENNNGYN